MIFTDFHDTTSELPAAKPLPGGRRPRYAEAIEDDVPEDPHWEDFGTASSLRPWGWST